MRKNDGPGEIAAVLVALVRRTRQGAGEVLLRGCAAATVEFEGTAMNGVAATLRHNNDLCRLIELCRRSGGKGFELGDRVEGCGLRQAALQRTALCLGSIEAEADAAVGVAAAGADCGSDTEDGNLVLGSGILNAGRERDESDQAGVAIERRLLNGLTVDDQTYRRGVGLDDRACACHRDDLLCRTDS